MRTGTFRPRSRPERFGDVLPAIVFLVLALLLPIVLTGLLDAPSELSVGMAFIITVYSAGRFARTLGKRRPNPLDGIFWLFVYVFLGLAMLAQVTENQWPLDSPPYAQRHISDALIVVVTGVAGYEAASLACGRWIRAPKRRRTSRRPIPLPTSRSAPRVSLSSSRAKLVGSVGLLFVLISVNAIGLRPFFESRDSVSLAFTGSVPGSPAYASDVENASVVAVLWSLARIPTFISLYVLLYIRRHVPSRSTARPVLLLILLVLANIIVNNPISNARFWSATVLVALASLVLPLNKQRTYRVVVLALLVVSLSGMGYLDLFRRTPIERERGRASTVSGFTESPDYSSSQQVVNGVRYTTTNGHALGKQFLSAALIWVPRSYWSDKPLDTGNLIAPETDLNVAATLWTEGWVDFGLPGTLLFLAVFGGVASLLGKTYAFSDTRQASWVAVVPLIAGFELMLLRGSLQSAVLNLLVIAVCVALCLTRRPRQGIPTSFWRDRHRPARPLSAGPPRATH